MSVISEVQGRFLVFSKVVESDRIAEEDGKNISFTAKIGYGIFDLLNKDVVSLTEEEFTSNEIKVPQNVVFLQNSGKILQINIPTIYFTKVDEEDIKKNKFACLFLNQKEKQLKVYQLSSYSLESNLRELLEYNSLEQKISEDTQFNSLKARLLTISKNNSLL